MVFHIMETSKIKNHCTVGLFHMNFYALIAAPMSKNILTHGTLAEFDNKVT